MHKLRLGDAMSVRHGYAFSGDGFSDDPTLPTLVTPGNFAIGGGFKEAKTKTFDGPYPLEYELSPGSIIVTMTDLSKGGDTLGLPAVVPAGHTYLHNQRIGLIKVTDPTQLYEPFLGYYLRNRSYRSHILGSATGSTVRHTSPSRIENFVAEIPGVLEQKAIAEVLGALDSKIAANTRAAEISLKLARAKYNRFVAGSARVSMAEVLEPVLGGTPARSDSSLWDGSVSWTSAKDITGARHGIVLSTSEGISETATKTKRLQPLPRGSVVLTARGTVGAVARLGIPAAINQSCYGFVPGDVPAGPLGFVIEDAASQARNMAHGSVFDTITMKTFEYVTLPDLSLESWKDVDAEIGPLIELCGQLAMESAQLEETRDGLLPLLMSGAIKVKDVVA